MSILRSINKPYINLIILFMVCFISRIPQLISPNLILDGDECVVALMAKQIYLGKDIGVYFYGQLYGCSIFETITIALFYALFGVSAVAVKLAMLAMWTTGILFFYKTLTLITPGSKSLALVITLLFIVCPCWAIWSMKARGGYSSAFLFTMIVIYIIFNATLIKQKSKLFLIGLLLVLIYQCQPLFLPGLLPLFAYQLYKNGLKREVVFIILGAVAPVILFAIVRNNTYCCSVHAPFVFDLDSLDNIGTLPMFVYHHLLGYFYFIYVYPPSVAAVVFAVVFIFIIGLLMLAGVLSVVARFCFKRIVFEPLFAVATLSIFFTLFYAIFRSDDSYRYLLPITGYSLFALFIIVQKIKKRLVVNVLLAGIIATGGVATVRFYDFSLGDAVRSDLFTTISLLEHDKIHYAFSGSMLQWQIMFYSNEHIICRSTGETDRYPEYVRAVDSVYKSSPGNTAFVEFYFAHKNLVKDGADSVNKSYVIMLKPGQQFLENNGYQFTK